MALAIWHGVIMISCVAILAIPYYKGPSSRKYHSWILSLHYPSRSQSTSIQGTWRFRRNHRLFWLNNSYLGVFFILAGWVPGDLVPFVVPNRSVVIAACEFFSNGMYLLLAVLCFAVRHLDVKVNIKPKSNIIFHILFCRGLGRWGRKANQFILDGTYHFGKLRFS